VSKPMTFDLSSLNGEVSLLRAVKAIREGGGRPIVQILDEKRTLPQNDLISSLYRDIAAAKGDMTFDEVRAHCKLHVGVRILRRDNEKFRAMYDKGLRDNLEYEEKIAAMEFFPVTSLMSKAQCSEYIDRLLKHWGEQGVYVSMPGDGY